MTTKARGECQRLSCYSTRDRDQLLRAYTTVFLSDVSFVQGRFAPTLRILRPSVNFLVQARGETSWVRNVCYS